MTTKLGSLTSAVMQTRAIRTSREARLKHIAVALALGRTLPTPATATDVQKVVSDAGGNTTLQRTVACLLGVKGLPGGTPSHMRWLYNDVRPDEATIRRDCADAVSLYDVPNLDCHSQVSSEAKRSESPRHEPMPTPVCEPPSAPDVVDATVSALPLSKPQPEIAVQWDRKSLLKVLAVFLTTPADTPPQHAAVVEQLAQETRQSSAEIDKLLRTLEETQGDFLRALTPLQCRCLSKHDRAAAKKGKALVRLADKALSTDADKLLLGRLADSKCPDVLAVRLDRRGQGLFRAAVLRNYEWRCCVSGASLPQLLEASHIAPWKEFRSRRNDPSNGLCLNALLHTAFDAGLFTITCEGTILVHQDIMNQFADSKQAEWGFLCRYHTRKIRPARYYKPAAELLLEHNRRSGIVGVQTDLIGSIPQESTRARSTETPTATI